LKHVVKSRKGDKRNILYGRTISALLEIRQHVRNLSKLMCMDY